MRERMSPADVMHFIAQGAVNVTTGLTTIEPGSWVHKAMEELCLLACEGRLKIDGGKFNETPSR